MAKMSYARWTNEDRELLIFLRKEGVSIKDIALHFERTTGAILSEILHIEDRNPPKVTFEEAMVKYTEAKKNG